MIKSFRHKELKAIYEGRPAKIPPDHLSKVQNVLTVLDHCSHPEGMNLPGFRLHKLRGKLKGHYAVRVSGNWRITFRFEEEQAIDVNYVDYH